MLKTLFLDRDGIVNEIVMRGETISSPRVIEEFVLRDDFLDFYEEIKRFDLRIFTVSNQPDVSRGLIAAECLERMVDAMKAQFKFTEIVHCTHDDQHACECRKPKPGMINALLHTYDLRPDEAIIIGDSYKDILAGKAAGITTVYLQQGYNAVASCEPDYIVHTLLEALLLPPFVDLK